MLVRCLPFLIRSEPSNQSSALNGLRDSLINVHYLYIKCTIFITCIKRSLKAYKKASIWSFFGGGGGVDKASFEVNCIFCRKWKQLKIESRIKFDSVHFKGNTFIASIDQKWPVVWKNTSQTYLETMPNNCAGKVFSNTACFAQIFNESQHAMQQKLFFLKTWIVGKHDNRKHSI